MEKNGLSLPERIIRGKVINGKHSCTTTSTGSLHTGQCARLKDTAARLWLPSVKDECSMWLGGCTVYEAYDLSHDAFCLC